MNILHRSRARGQVLAIIFWGVGVSGSMFSCILSGQQVSEKSPQDWIQVRVIRLEVQCRLNLRQVVRSVILFFVFTVSRTCRSRQCRLSRFSSSQQGVSVAVVGARVNVFSLPKLRTSNYQLGKFSVAEVVGVEAVRSGRVRVCSLSQSSGWGCTVS